MSFLVTDYNFSFFPQKFSSVKEIIDFYKYVPITLIDRKDKSWIQREQCYLTYPFKLHKRCFLP